MGRVRETKQLLATRQPVVQGGALTAPRWPPRSPAPAAATLAEPHTIPEKAAAAWQQARSFAQAAPGAARARARQLAAAGSQAVQLGAGRAKAVAAPAGTWLQQAGARAGAALRKAAGHVRAAATAARARVRAAAAAVAGATRGGQ